jgi:hypothetical protein
MAISVTINGTNYSIPTKGEEGWAANVTALLLALSSGLLQKSGGSFPLTAEVDFGNSFGLATIYIKSKSTNPGTSGVLRLASGDQIVWRNFNNTGNLILEYFRNTDFSYNILRFNGKEIIDQDSQQFLQNKIFGTPSLTPIEPSAIFEVRSTTKGALPYPKMTTAQRDAIPSPTRGLIIYNLTDDATQFYNGTSWVSPATITNTPTWAETNVAPTAASVESRFLRKNGGLDESTTKTVFDGLDVSKTFVDADVNITTDSIQEVAHEFLTGDLCVLSTTGVLPAPLAVNTTYYIIRVDADNFRFATSYANAKSATPINITSALGGGTHTVSVRSGVRFLQSPYAFAPFLFQAGSPSAPAMTAQNNQQTGIYFPALNQIGFVTNGAERFRILETGQLQAVYESTVGADFNTTLHNGYLCRAWVNFSDATGTVVIGSSGNVSSITDNGTGDYTANFTVALPDANYSIAVSSRQNGSTVGGAGYSSSRLAGSLRYIFTNFESTLSNRDQEYASLAVFR